MLVTLVTVTYSRNCDNIIISIALCISSVNFIENIAYLRIAMPALSRLRVA